MTTQISKYKIIFEDNSLSDQEKYKKISNLQNKASKFWSIVLGLNVIFWPFLFIFTNIETDNSNLSPIVFLKNSKM
tara:strand:- start:519 stop:746 length:228 start_codon:yes stop_codon:yes gene_type:complete